MVRQNKSRRALARPGTKQGRVKGSATMTAQELAGLPWPKLLAQVEAWRSRQAELEQDNEELHRARAKLQSIKEESAGLRHSLAECSGELHAALDQLKLMCAAMAHLGEGIVITSDDLEWPGPKILFVNDAMCRITGYSRDELLGQTPRLLQGNKTDRATRDCLRRELSAGRACSVELINYRKDGTPYHAELFVSPLNDAAGRRTNFVSIHRDITERKTAQQGLREREELLSAILNTASDAIITLDRQGLIVGLNPATERMFGYAAAELIGQNVSLLMPSPFREEHDRYLARYQRTGRASIIGQGRELVARRKDGTVFPVFLSISKIDHLGLFTGILHDISNRRQLQQQIVQAADEEQRRIAQDLHDSLGSHLNGIALYSQSLCRDLQAQGLPQSKDAARMTELLREAIEQCRSVARGLHAVEADPEGLIRALRHLAAEKRSQKIKCRVQCPRPVLVADSAIANHLYRIAQEAITNAIRHGQAGRIDILLRRDGETLELRIRDNGRGMPKRKPARAKGLGLDTMAYRAGLINGLLEIKRGHPRGVVLQCRVPLKTAGSTTV